VVEVYAELANYYVQNADDNAVAGKLLDMTIALIGDYLIIAHTEKNLMKKM